MEYQKCQRTSCVFHSTNYASLSCALDKSHYQELSDVCIIPPDNNFVIFNDEERNPKEPVMSCLNYITETRDLSWQGRENILKYTEQYKKERRIKV